MYFLASRYIPHIAGLVEWGNLMLKYFLNFPGILTEAFHARQWRNSTAPFASLQERRNQNIKYFTFSGGNRTHNLSRLVARKQKILR